MWRLNGTLLNNYWADEEIKSIKKKYTKPNENKKWYAKDIRYRKSSNKKLIAIQETNKPKILNK